MLFKRLRRVRRRRELPGFLPRLPVAAADGDAQAVSSVERLLLGWAQGIAIGAPLFVVIATMIRGWQHDDALRAIAVIGLLAFVWSYLLARLARQVGLAERVAGPVFWLNSIVLTLLMTAGIAVSGASLSPLFWLYGLVIVADTLQDRRRGLMIARMSCGLFCGLIAAQALQWLPDEQTGIIWEHHPLADTWLIHALGIAIGYLIVALAISGFTRWVGRYERELCVRREDVAARERSAEIERTKLHTEHQAFGQRVFQFDQVRHQCDSDHQRWERERQQWDVERAQAAQQLTDTDASLKERMRELEARAAHLLTIQHQFDTERTAWEQERTRTIKTLDDREADLREQAREFDETKQTFETHRAQTTQSLIQLEETLLASLKRVGEEMGQVETKRKEFEAARRQLTASQEEWAREQVQAAQRIGEQEIGLAAQSHQLAALKEQIAKAQENATREIAARHAELRDRLARCQEAEQHVASAQAAWETQHAQITVKLTAAETDLARREAEVARRQDAMGADAATVEVARAHYEQAQAALDAQRRQLEEDAQRIAQARQVTEQEQQRIVHELTGQERSIHGQVAQLGAQRQELETLRAQLTEQAKQLDLQRQALSEEHTKWEQERDRTARAVSAAPRGLLGHAYRALQGQARRLREQGHDLAQRQRGLATRERTLEQQGLDVTRREHDFEQAHKQFETERTRILEQLRPRELQLAEQLQRVGNDARRLNTERVAIEQARRDLESVRAAKGSAEQQQFAAQEAQLRKVREAMEVAQRAVDASQDMYDGQRRSWETSQRAAEDALAARERELTEQRQRVEASAREFAQKCQEWERTHGATDKRLTKQAQAVSGRLREIETSEQQLEVRQQQLDAQRREIEHQQQQLTQASTHWEQEHAVRLEQLEQLRKQLEEERREAGRQRDQVETSRQQVAQEQQQLEDTRRQLNEARRLLTDASITQVPDRFSSETLTLLANEFNAPLASLNALLSTLMAKDHGDLTPAVVDALRDVTATNARLCRVVADVLDAARIEHGQFPLSVQQVVLHEVLTRAQEDVQGDAARKGLTLSRQGSDTVAVAADKEQLYRILVALLRNGVQYTEHGGVTITSSADAERVTITIADTGVGMQTAQLGRLFAKPKLGMLIHGRGLSLYLARSLARLMSGDISLISSELEGGSTFAVTLPRTARAAVPAGAPAPAGVGT